MEELLRLVDADERSLGRRVAAALAVLPAGVIVSTAVLYYTGRDPVHLAVLRRKRS